MLFCRLNYFSDIKARKEEKVSMCSLLHFSQKAMLLSNLLRSLSEIVNKEAETVTVVLKVLSSSQCFLILYQAKIMQTAYLLPMFFALVFYHKNAA